MINGSYSGTYEVFDTRLIGIEAIWEIVLQARNDDVFKKASKFLLQLFKSLSKELKENLPKIKENFLQICMSNIDIGVDKIQSS